MKVGEQNKESQLSETGVVRVIETPLRMRIMGSYSTGSELYHPLYGLDVPIVLSSVRAVTWNWSPLSSDGFFLFD